MAVFEFLNNNTPFWFKWLSFLQILQLGWVPQKMTFWIAEDGYLWAFCPSRHPTNSVQALTGTQCADSRQHKSRIPHWNPEIIFK